VSGVPQRWQQRSQAQEGRGRRLGRRPTPEPERLLLPADQAAHAEHDRSQDHRIGVSRSVSMHGLLRLLRLLIRAQLIR
jgi:hypothetical protein